MRRAPSYLASRRVSVTQCDRSEVPRVDHVFVSTRCLGFPAARQRYVSVSSRKYLCVCFSLFSTFIFNTRLLGSVTHFVLTQCSGTLGKKKRVAAADGPPSAVTIMSEDVRRQCRTGCQCRKITLQIGMQNASEARSGPDLAGTAAEVPSSLKCNSEPQRVPKLPLL
jgi:hypothetical protein